MTVRSTDRLGDELKAVLIDAAERGDEGFIKEVLASVIENDPTGNLAGFCDWLYSLLPSQSRDTLEGLTPKL